MLELGVLSQKEYLVNDVDEKVASNGNKYWYVKLSNKQEEISGKVWEEDKINCQISKNKVVVIDGIVSAFMGKPNLTIKRAKVVEKEIGDFLPKIPTMVFDIETVGKKFKDLDKREQDYLLNNLEKDQTDKNIAKEKTGLYAIFGMVCAIGMYNPETEKGVVLVISDKDNLKPEKQNYTYKIFTDEKSLLEEFWKVACNYQKFVSYNGRNFDMPYLTIRSGINRVKVNNIAKINSEYFIDLQDKIKQSRPFKLEILCKAFGVENPKEAGVSGLAINDLFDKKSYQIIADYVARDAYSTAELYRVWKEFMS